LVGGLGEPGRAVHAVVVGDRDGVEFEARRLLDQFLGVARAVEEAEVGVTVQFGVGNPAAGSRVVPARWAQVRGLGVLLPLPAPCRAVVPVPRLRWYVPARQGAFQFPPRNRRIVPAHAQSLSGERLGCGITGHDIAARSGYSTSGIRSGLP